MSVAVRDFLKPLESELIEFAQGLVRIKSVTGEEGEAARFVRDKMVALDYDQVYIDEIGNVIGIIGNGPRTVLFDSHLDTVQADKDSGWTVDPFGGEIRDGYLYGRGAVDMKSAVAATVYAGHAVKKLGIGRDKKIVVSISVMEESFDGEALYHICTKGGIQPDFTVICEPSNLKLALGHNGRAMLVVRTHGMSAHASSPQSGDNAVYKMAGIIRGVEAMQAEFAGSTERSGSVALSKIESVADSLNAVPSECCVYLDRRTVAGEDELTLKKEMETLISGVDASWDIHEENAYSWTGEEISTRSYYPAWEIEAEHPLVRACQDTYRELFGELPEEILWDFCTNGVSTAGKLGIPTIGLGPGDPLMAHMADERCATGQIFDAWMGTAVVIVMALIAAYYSAVIAWVAYYLGLSVTKGYYGTDRIALFDSVAYGNPITVLLFIAVLAFSAWIAYKGVKGIEKANRFFLPALIICILIAAIRSLTLPNASIGLNYLFSFKFSELLHYKVWLEGLTQAVWSAGPGWGLVITLAVFSKAKSDVSLTTMTQVFGNASISLVAALAVIPAIFALSPSLDAAMEVVSMGNNGLTFIAMTQLFEAMPGGYLIGIIFFMSLLFAAISSNIVHFVIVSLPISEMGITKKQAVVGAFFVLLVLGLPSAWNVDFLSNQDWVAGQMMLVGALFSCFAIYKFGAAEIRTKYLNNKYSGLHIGKWWEGAVKYLAPLTILIMFTWWSWQSISWDPQWWNPLAVFSLATFVVQGALIILIAVIFNNKINKGIKHQYYEMGAEFPEVPANEFSG